MSNRILVTYATRAGSTVEVAATVGEALSGKMDYSRLLFLDRTIAKAVEKQANSRPGDYRDWERIRAWAQALYPVFSVDGVPYSDMKTGYPGGRKE